MPLNILAAIDFSFATASPVKFLIFTLCCSFLYFVTDTMHNISLIVVKNLINRDVFDWIGCLPSMELNFWAIVTLWSLGLFREFVLLNSFYQEFLCRFFFSCF